MRFRRPSANRARTSSKSKVEAEPAEAKLRELGKRRFRCDRCGAFFERFQFDRRGELRKPCDDAVRIETIRRTTRGTGEVGNARRLERERQLPLDETARLVALLANALDYAHAQGVIHPGAATEVPTIQIRKISDLEA